jgi:hypothetical protein
MWEFEDAPSNLKQLVSKEFAGGWLALVYSCGGTDFAGSLAACWRSLGLSLVLHRTEDGGTLLAGLHPETAAALNEVAGD